MLIFYLASCLTTFSLSRFMDLRFQIHMQYCSLQHQTLLSPPDTSTTEHHFHFGPAASFFLDLLVIALSSSPVAYWIPSDLGGLIFWCHIFLPFHTVHGVLQARILAWTLISYQSTTFCKNSSVRPGHPGWLCTHGS